MVGTLVSQLTKGVCPEVLKREGLGEYYTDHGISVYPQSAAGIPFSASVLAVKGDPVTDLYEDMAAEQKARNTYEYLIDLSDDPDVTNVLKFLREREIVHFQRFGEALRTVQEKLAQKKFYMNGMEMNNVLGANNNNNNSNAAQNTMSANNSCGCNNANMGTNNSNTCPKACDNVKGNNCGCGNK